MTRRRAVSILRRWSSYDNETIVEAQEAIRMTGWSHAGSLSQAALYGGAILIAALLGLVGVAQFLGAGL